MSNKTVFPCDTDMLYLHPEQKFLLRVDFQIRTSITTSTQWHNLRGYDLDEYGLHIGGSFFAEELVISNIEDGTWLLKIELEEELKLITNEELSQMPKAELYALRVQVQNYISQFENTALNAFKLGIPVDDYALKPGRKSRLVADEKELVKDLTAEGIPYNALFTAKLIGVPAIEKLLKGSNLQPETAKTLYDRHIIEAIGNPTLVFTGSGTGNSKNG